MAPRFLNSEFIQTRLNRRLGYYSYTPYNFLSPVEVKRITDEVHHLWLFTSIKQMLFGT